MSSWPLTLYGLALLVPATADALDAVDARVLDAATAMGVGRLRCFLTVSYRWPAPRSSPDYAW